MTGWLSNVCLLVTLAPMPPETQFIQLAPPSRPGQPMERSADQKRAVVLIQGFHLHPPGSKDTARAIFTSWQQPNSALVRTLAADADVFAFAYGQTVPVTEIAVHPGLAAGIRRLRELGYREVVLVGFSAGGLVARQFVEDQPEAGVTKVVQVCSPNGGSGWARLKAAVAGTQEPFVQSLTKEARARWLEERREKRILDKVEFVCIVGNGLGYGDGIVTLRSQWTEDLQRQGIPATLLRANHLRAVRNGDGTRVIAELVTEPQPRWDAGRVRLMRNRLWREQTDDP